MSNLRENIERRWYGRPGWLLMLAPLVPVFAGVSALRRRWLSRRAEKHKIPVVVVGNITVGGTGKTPVIIALVNALAKSGYKPGVIARGYGVNLLGSRVLPGDAKAADFGDEPVLIAQATGCRVAVGPNRTESVDLLKKQYDCNIILSDDGLQHYRLSRDVEIAIVDGARQLGNGWHLPVGPLREGKDRLQQVNFVLINGGQALESAPAGRSFPFLLRPVGWRHVATGQFLALGELSLEGAVAVAGIGNPQRFFGVLASLGFSGPCHGFADHHAFDHDDFNALGANTILMTEKDAVKCRSFAGAHWWALSVEAQLPDDFLLALQQSI